MKTVESFCGRDDNLLYRSVTYDTPRDAPDAADTPDLDAAAAADRCTLKESAAMH